MTFIDHLKKYSEDTLFRGFICGLTAGALKDLIDFVLYSIEAKEHVFWHFTSILAFHKPPHGVLMHFSALFLELIFSGFLGFIFVLFAQKIKTRHYLLLGFVYGTLVWFSIKGLIVASEIEELKSTTISHPLLTWFLSAFFGFVVSLLERYLSPKTS